MSRRPVATNCISAAVLFGVGDILAQTVVPATQTGHHVIETDIKRIEHKLEDTSKNLDWARTTKATIYGGFIFAPLASKFWYPFLNSLRGSTPAKTALKRVAFDQLGFSPLCGIPLYYTCLGIMDGKSSSEIREHLSKNYKTTLFTNWSIWPMVQFLNFRFMPPDYRLLMVNTISIGWNTFLSYMNNRA